MFRKNKIFVFVIIIYCLSAITAQSEQYFNKEMLDSIDQNVFEVVLLKPTADSLSYEKPLPLDLIPFNERNDKYLSIGTAFAISENKFLTAAHVFFLEKKTQYKNIYIRDKQKNVYEVNLYCSYTELVLLSILF